MREIHGDLWEEVKPLLEDLDDRFVIVEINKD